MSSTLSIFEAYARTALSRDEWRAEHPGVTAAYDQIENVLTSMPPGELDRLARRAHDLMRDQGITFNFFEHQESAERILPFDLFPLAIAAQEWSEIELGLAQRMKAWNAFLKDIYGAQEILKSNAVPYDIVYRDPNYHRECVGLKVPNDIYLHVGASDLIRDSQGRWLVLEDQLSNPTGASYALQNRRVLSQTCPQLMEGLPILPIYNYPTQLLETLQAVAPRGAATARVVMLSSGIYHEAYYDHAAMARQMGIPLVEPGDLIVLDSNLYLKTINGLEQIDVIYRRLDTDMIDPVTMRGESKQGLPGLFSCLRKGTVAVANALGSGLGDNRALAGYVGTMIDYYLNEEPILPSVTTLTCRDLDVREEIFEHWDKYVIKAVGDRGLSSVWVGKEMDETEREDMKKQIGLQPADYVAQPMIQFSTAPTWINSTFQPRHVGLRVFALQQSTVEVMPCALTRVALTEGSLVVSTAAGGGAKDTWILRGEQRETAHPEWVMRHPPRRLSLGSRTADSLYWIGRYAERAEATTRILLVIQQLRLEDNSYQQNPKAWHPLWEALASATGHPTSFFKKASIQKSTSLSQYILLEQENYASTLSCLDSCRQNAQEIREALPPEVWTILNRLYLQLAQSAQQKDTPGMHVQLQSLSLHENLLSQLDGLAGAAEKHMLHNDAWHFWQIGRFVERAMFTAMVTRQVFLKRQDEKQAGLASEDRNLDSLLRMLAGQYAYRSSYKSRPVASQVAHLLIQDDEFPRSLSFCIEAIQYNLRRTFGEKRQAEAPLRYCNHLLSELTFADVNNYFQSAGTTETNGRPVGLPKQKSKAFADWLETLIARMFGLGDLISDHYLNHQAAEALRLAQN